MRAPPSGEIRQRGTAVYPAGPSGTRRVAETPRTHTRRRRRRHDSFDLSNCQVSVGLPRHRAPPPPPDRRRRRIASRAFHDGLRSVRGSRRWYAVHILYTIHIHTYNTYTYTFNTYIYTFNTYIYYVRCRRPAGFGSLINGGSAPRSTAAAAKPGAVYETRGGERNTCSVCVQRSLATPNAQKRRGLAAHVCVTQQQRRLRAAVRSVGRRDHCSRRMGGLGGERTTGFGGKKKKNVSYSVIRTGMIRRSDDRVHRGKR